LYIQKHAPMLRIAIRLRSSVGPAAQDCWRVSPGV
jgi:hypothetical protein